MTDDPLYDFDRWDARREEWLKTRPVCDECGEPIQEEYGYSFEGQLLCEDCFQKLVKNEFRVNIESLIEGED